MYYLIEKVTQINNLALKGKVCCSLVVVRLRGSYLNNALKAKLDPQLVV
jgi:hypothetical protein